MFGSRHSRRYKYKQILLSFVLFASVFAPKANANILGSDFQSFNPTSDGLDFVTVQSVRTLAPGVFALGGFLDAAYNTLPPALDANNNKFKAKDQLFSSDLHMALGLTRDWEIGTNLQAVLLESINVDQLKGYFVKNGLTDFRLNTKYRLLGTGSKGVSVNLSAEFPQIVNDPFFGSGGSANYTGELIAQTKIGRLAWAGNFGYVVRATGPALVGAPFEPVGNQITASTGLEYRLEKTNFAIMGEMFAAVPTAGTKNYSSGDLTALEALLGAKYFGFKNFTAHSGITGQIMRGMSSPDIRIYAGINWYPARLWGGGDKPRRAARPAPRPTPSAAPSSTVIDPILNEPTPPEIAAAPVVDPEPVSTSSASNTSVFDKEPTAATERFIVRDVNFLSGSAEIPASFEPYLRKLAEYLSKGSGFTYMQIYGYTDSTGSAVLNQELSQKRAESVKQALITRYSVDGEKVEAIGMGPANPISTNDTAEGRSLNRRVELKIDR